MMALFTHNRKPRRIFLYPSTVASGFYRVNINFQVTAITSRLNKCLDAIQDACYRLITFRALGSGRSRLLVPFGHRWR